MRFVSFEEVAARLKGKRIAVVGSGPGSLDNEPGFVDSHDIVVRANNYKTGDNQGFRTDVHYSFYGTSIRKTREELAGDGVTLCMCKCPNSKPIESEWHERMGKQVGIDFQYIYRNRAPFWFCDTFIPDDAHFLRSFELLDRHIPTTGFSAILDVLACEPANVYLTGFDFFTSGIHNVDEKWKAGNPEDPICHRPDLEAAWLRANRAGLTFDKRLQQIMEANDER
ncbi:hypothetical protein ACHMW6_06405 [Pseudoduganella sp. UC29_106]|uniref:hypothetical protein n=1 Tax=Pseudoduganella sp. UC29_106 TaxID=3374553 RepID=UPI00375656A5